MAGRKQARWQALQLLELRPSPAGQTPGIPSLLPILSSSLQSHAWFFFLNSPILVKELHLSTKGFDVFFWKL